MPSMEKPKEISINDEIIKSRGLLVEKVKKVREEINKLNGVIRYLNGLNCDNVFGFDRDNEIVQIRKKQNEYLEKGNAEINEIVGRIEYLVDLKKRKESKLKPEPVLQPLEKIEQDEIEDEDLSEKADVMIESMEKK